MYLGLSQNKKGKELYEVTSTIDNEKYLVKKTENELNDIIRADKLAKVKNKIEILTKSLSSSDEKRKLLEFAPLKLQERDTDRNIGYTINKGEKIGLCIEDDENTLFFVVLHELAHIITKSYGHPPEFWNNFQFLIKQSIKVNIYNYKNYNEKSINYCNKDIIYTPYKK